jgi:glycosyltransferase involved in cell wall biosynthesis
MKVAVILAAFQAENWIADSIRSIRSQRLPGGWHLDLRIGVDGCERTSRFLRLLNEGHWFSPCNVGAYVMRNSLINLAEADAYAPFDADDMMLEGYLNTLIRFAVPDSIAGAGRITSSQDQFNGEFDGYSNGVCVISKNAWNRLGGYASWRIAADHELIKRALALGIKVKSSAQTLFLRRVHGNNLTTLPDTGKGSIARKAKKLEAELNILTKDLFVMPDTTELSWRSAEIAVV